MTLVVMFLCLSLTTMLISIGYELLSKHYHNQCRQADALIALINATDWGMTSVGFLCVALLGLLFI